MGQIPQGREDMRRIRVSLVLGDRIEPSANRQQALKLREPKQKTFPITMLTRVMETFLLKVDHCLVDRVGITRKHTPTVLTASRTDKQYSPSSGTYTVVPATIRMPF